ncbi:hypothetical protein M758_1G039400 [Ceratodon purpureus]|nr:hypothetical protein M758_1G039400 [Ceratodon purpureus]
MGDSIAEELVQLLRGINATLTVKLSHLLGFVFRNKNASSVGAVAGLAIALWWTWKCWRVPGARRDPRLDKRDGAGAGAASQAPAAGEMDDAVPGASSTAVATSITHATQRGSGAEGKVVETGELTVAQVVRRQLNGGRKMTCQLLGVILEESSPEEVQKHAVVRPAVVDVLLEIARTCDLYLVARVLDDASEAVVMGALDAVGLFTDAKLSREKVLFCSTEAGRTSFVRQLEPDWHVDTLRDINAGLAPFVRQQLHVAPPGASPIAQNVYIVEALEQYFSGAFCS